MRIRRKARSMHYEKSSNLQWQISGRSTHPSLFKNYVVCCIVVLRCWSHWTTYVFLSFNTGYLNQVSLQCDYDLLHYIVALPFAVATPSAMVVATEIWSWLIAEKSVVEVALMSEIVSAWSLTIKHEKGIFSRHMKSVQLGSHLIFS